jgi:hypothetical protein
MVDPKEISRRFKLLKNADPKLYEQLVRLLDMRLYDIVTAVTQAPPDQILVCQGRAQEALKFFQIFTELPEEPPQQPVTHSPGP